MTLGPALVAVVKILHSLHLDLKKVGADLRILGAAGRVEAQKVRVRKRAGLRPKAEKSDGYGCQETADSAEEKDRKQSPSGAADLHRCCLRGERERDRQERASKRDHVLEPGVKCSTTVKLPVNSAYYLGEEGFADAAVGFGLVHFRPAMIGCARYRNGLLNVHRMGNDWRMGIDATSLIGGALGGAALQSVLEPLIGQRHLRRDLRANVLQAVTKVQDGRLGTPVA